MKAFINSRSLVYPIIEMRYSIICIIIIMISYLLICQDKPEYLEYQVIITTIIPTLQKWNY